MRITALLAAIAFLSLPTLAAAECSWGMGHEVTMSCTDGATWDADTQSCVPVVSS